MKKKQSIRYTRISDIIQLMILMCRPSGVTLQEILEEFSVSRRTAEHMRDCILNVLPQIEEIETNDTCKHWGFINFSIGNIFVNSKITNEGT